MTYKLTLADFEIKALDEAYIERLEMSFDVSRYDVDLSDIFRNGQIPDITNHIIYKLLYNIISDNVDDEDDRQIMIESIYTNCLDSWIDCNDYDLRTKKAKKLLEEINNN